MLRQPADDGRDAAVRWRQLVDLIARAGAAADPALLAESLDVIRTDAKRVEEPLRAAAARAIAALPLPLGLLQCFVADRLSVSAPILAAARLDSAQWSALLEIADAETRRFIETLHPDVLPPDRGQEGPGAQPFAGRPADVTISELVSRIERRRTARAPAAPPAAPALQPGEPGLFKWEAGAGGEIDWVEGVPRGAMVGRSIARAPDGGRDALSEAITRAFARRAPFRDGELVVAGEGPAAGRWLVSGIPAFDPGDGRFRGFRGLARRAPAAGARADSAEPAQRPMHLPLDGDSLRELVHELKTPLNAIIGFAEIIEGQFLGPAGRRYRSRALDIAAEARMLLLAIDDLDLAARTRARSVAGVDGTRLDRLVGELVQAQRKTAERRGVELLFAPPAAPVAAAIDEELLARVAGRVLGAAVELAVSGERLGLGVTRHGQWARLTIARPVALSSSAAEGAVSAAYPLRLARGLARLVGGEVRIEDKVIAAEFPAA